MERLERAEFDKRSLRYAFIGVASDLPLAQETIRTVGRTDGFDAAACDVVSLVVTRRRL